MFYFFKIIQQLILPSIFLFFLFLLSLFLILKKKKTGKYLLIFSIFLYYFFSITPTSDFLICPLEKGYSQEQDKQEIPFIVVLSGGLMSQSEKDRNSLSESSLKRAIRAFKIYQESSLKPKIILSGNFSSFKNEAEEMANFLFSLGIPKEDVIIEREA
ncbi:YdcF family protein, partial [bacterium]|nr:YdcF family protein [bacterium]